MRDRTCHLLRSVWYHAFKPCASHRAAFRNSYHMYPARQTRFAAAQKYALPPIFSRHLPCTFFQPLRMPSDASPGVL